MTKPYMKLILTVECDLYKRYVDDPKTIVEDLKAHLVKIKSGIYENRFYGNITEVKIVERRADKTRKYRGKVL